MAELLVFMDGALCGTLEQDASGDLRFRYDEEYRSVPEATPLSLSMPLVHREHRKRVVLPFLDGLLTDNQEARAAIARRFEVNPRNPFAILEHIGADVAGALQILPPDVEPTDGPARGGDLHPLSDTEASQALGAIVDEYRTGRVTGAESGRFSLAGAQPKLALCRTSEGEWAVPSGSIPTTHILKPQAGAFSRLDIVEHMTMRAASWLGLEVANTWLEVVGDWQVVVVERYDRAWTRGLWHRLHQEDLAQALGVPPSKKYQHMDGGPGVGEVARLFRTLPRPGDRADAAWRFFQGLAFNVVFRCTDAHVKNYSILLRGSQVALAPLYDLATIIPYDRSSAGAASAMKVGDHYRFDAIGDADFARAATTLGLDTAQALEFVYDLQRRSVDAFEAARAQTAAVAPEAAAMAERVVESVVRALG
ncbi:MAG: HipA domain-containing protein [Micrococcales bacterium]|nr:HipA domain-containing protein [Micrococcales bacterium]